MRHPLLRILTVTLLAGLASGSLAMQVATPAGQSSDAKSSSTPNSIPPDGEVVFKSNCGRCHMPPMTISPRVTGTIVMHMRTRARLSRKDEELLLKYLAP